jgi:GT2 family glycosyltransferase
VTEQPTDRPAEVTVVVVTRDRRAAAVATVEALLALPERPQVVCVDNASTDGTAAAVADACPQAQVVRVPRNLGAVGRNVGVARARTPYVAFADDDSLWRPGALAAAVRHFTAAPRLGLLAARILVGTEGRLDPASAAMAASPLSRRTDLPGPAVLGFLACGVVVRRRAFLAVGGFSPVLFFLGEEQQLALDLALDGWGLAYADDVVAEHHPGGIARPTDARRRLHQRNDLLTAWLRRPAPVAARRTLALALAGRTDPAARGALLDAAKRLPDVMARRRAVPQWLEEQVQLLETGS